MMKRILCALALVAAFAGTVAQSASADTVPHAASVAVSRILGSYQGALFSTGTSPDCANSDRGGNCWWWAANAFMSLITYAEENPNDTNTPTIKSDLAQTYSAICGGNCPTSANQTGSDPFVTNPATGNVYFDDIGWWEQAWINAYKWTGIHNYLYLAEQLWHYMTANGWIGGCNGDGGVVQFIKSGGALGGKDAFANALYLRDSAWLYSITGDSKYMEGDGQGGAFAAANFVRQHLIYHYNDVTLGTPGSEFMIADHVDTSSSCAAAGAQPWLQSQGEMVNAWTDMYAADKAYCNVNPGCATAPGFYNNLADELALSTISDKLDSKGSWPFQGMPGQKEPTVDTNGILSEPCLPTGTNTWPRGCALGTSVSDFQPYLISKGIFERGIYCSNHNFNDTDLQNFISANAASLAGLPNFGFLWDSSGDNQPVIFATRASVLDGLDAQPGGSFAMC
jgi:hypothetical protein